MFVGLGASKPEAQGRGAEAGKTNFSGPQEFGVQDLGDSPSPAKASPDEGHRRAILTLHLQETKRLQEPKWQVKEHRHVNTKHSLSGRMEQRKWRTPTDVH